MAFKNQNLRASLNNNLNHKNGFTILESILAISILAVVAVQILNVQSSSIQITNTSRNHMYATWALKSILAQVRYVKDTVGIAALPKETDQVWSPNQDFKFKVEVKENPIEASRLLKAVQGASNSEEDSAGGSNAPEENSENSNGQKDSNSMFDQILPKDMYNTVKMSVYWMEGDAKKSFDSGLMTIDSTKVKLPEIPGGAAFGETGDKNTNDTKNENKDENKPKGRPENENKQ
jgi:prepilin-type N-terminal cleavage/methylation domain-containing protein